MDHSVKVFLVDDHAIVRDGLKLILESFDEIEVIGESENARDAIKMMELVKPEVVLMDINMGGMNGIEASKIIKQNYPEIKVIILSMELTPDHVSEAIKAGVNGYIPKDIRKYGLLEAILKVHSGTNHFSEQVSELIFKNFYDQSLGHENVNKSSKPGILSQRELEVLTLICDGFSNKEIAEMLFISVRTVDAHRNNMMQKIQVNNTAALVKYAFSNGLVDI